MDVQQLIDALIEINNATVRTEDEYWTQIAQAIADSDASHSLTPPSNPNLNDIWVDGNGKMHYWNGTQWRDLPTTDALAQELSLQVNERIDAIASQADKTNNAAEVAQFAADAAQLTADAAVIAAAAAQDTADQVTAAEATLSGTVDDLAISLTTKAATDFSNVGDGTVIARLMAAGSVLAHNLVVTNFDNLIPNPNCFITNPLAGSLEAEGLVNYGAGFSTNGWYRRLVQVNAPGTSYLRLTNNIPAVEGDQFYFECWGFYGNVVPSAGQGARIIIAAYNSAGAYINAGYSSFITTGSNTGQKISTNFTCPAGTQHILAYVTYDGGSNSNNVYTSRFYLRRMNDGSLIVDGAITADKIAAYAITTAKMVVTNFDNLIPNPNSEITGLDTNQPDGRGVTASASAYNGGYVRRFTYTGAGTGFGYLTNEIPAIEGDQFYFEAQARVVVGGDPALIYARVTKTDGSTTFFNSSNGTTVYPAWGKISVSFVCPANTKSVAFAAKVNSATNGNQADFDALYARRMADANLIVDGAISANKIAANSIYAKHLVLTDFENLCGNPSGELDATGSGGVSPDGWVGSLGGNGSPILSYPVTNWGGTPPQGGSWGSTQRAMRWDGRDIYYGQYFQVNPNDKFFVSFDVLNPSAAGWTTVGLNFKDGDGGDVNWLGPSIAPGAGWRTVTGVVTAPANSVRARIWGSNSGNTGETVIRNVRIQRQNNANLIVDGTITATKLAANSVTADKIAAGVVSADKISVTDLSAINSNLGHVTVDPDGLTVGQYPLNKLLAMRTYQVFTGGGAGKDCIAWDGSTVFKSGVVGPTGWSDIVWCPGFAGGEFIWVNGQGASTSGHFLRDGSSAGAMGNTNSLIAVAYGEISGTPYAIAVREPPSSLAIYVTTNGSSWISGGVQPVGLSYRGQHCAFLKGPEKFMFVGQDTNSNAVAWVCDGAPNVATNWRQCFLPANTGGTVANPRTVSTESGQGIVVGAAGNRMIIRTQYHGWYSDDGGTTWIHYNHTLPSTPCKAAHTSFTMIVTYNGTDARISSDGLNWRPVTIGGFPSSLVGICTQELQPGTKVYQYQLAGATSGGPADEDFLS